MKLWSGMLTGDLDKLAEEFNDSIKIDKRLVFVDIKASIGHVKMLGAKNIISYEQSSLIIKGLENIYKKIKRKKPSSR